MAKNPLTFAEIFLIFVDVVYAKFARFHDTFLRHFWTLCKVIKKAWMFPN